MEKSISSMENLTNIQELNLVISLSMFKSNLIKFSREKVLIS